VRAGALLLVAAAATAGELRLVDAPAEEPRPQPAWAPSFEAARAAAERDRKPLLLYFTAKW